MGSRPSFTALSGALSRFSSSMKMLQVHTDRLARLAAQCLAGGLVVAALTFVCFRLRFNLATTACLYLMAIVLLSLQGSFLSSTVASLLGVGCLAYYFAPPIHSFRVEDPFNVAAIFTFLTVSAVITRLVASVHKRAPQLALTNATLEGQIAERKQAEEALLDARAALERVTRVTNLAQLTASIAHEINQPLAGAVTNANAWALRNSSRSMSTKSFERWSSSCTARQCDTPYHSGRIWRQIFPNSSGIACSCSRCC